MSLWNIIRKELKELLTVTTIVPIIVMALLFGSMGSFIGGIGEELKQKPIIGIINNDQGNYSARAVAVLDATANIVYNGNDFNQGLSTVRDKGGLALLVIPSNFTSNIDGNRSGTIEVFWVMKGTGLMDSVSSGTLEQLFYYIDQELSKELIESSSQVNSTVALHPTSRYDTTYFKGREMKGLSPGAISGMMTSQSIMVPIMIMILIMMSGGMVISSMGMEKENKTLETLLTLPVSRSAIVTGKIAGSAIVGLIMAVIYMVGFSYYMSGMGSSTLNLEQFGLKLGLEDYLLVGISLFVTLLAGLALCLVLGTFATNFKSAQTLTFPVTMLAMIPMFILMFSDFDTLPLALKAVVFALPFSHPMMAMRALLFDDYALVIGGIVYVTVFAIIMIFIAVRIFRSDRLLVGSSRLRSIKLASSMPILSWLLGSKKK